MTDKNKELAELLGINPDNNCGIRYSCNKNTPCFECTDRSAVYPDFAKPENFVKLVELLNKYSSRLLLHIVLSPYSCQGFVKGGLSNLCFKLQNHNDKYNLDNFEEVKQQAQKIDWIY